MKVSELAKEFSKSSDDILKMLKSLKLKAKDANQELSGAVVSVIKSQFGLDIKKPAGKDESVAKKSVKTELPSKSAKKKEPAKAKEKAKPKKSVKVKPVSSSVKKTKTAAKKSVETKESEVKAKTKKVVSRPVRTTATGAIVKKKKTAKKAPKKKAVKSFPKISDAPVITLKPLARKKEKSLHPEKEMQSQPPLPCPTTSSLPPRTSNTMLKRSGESGYPCLVPEFKHEGYWLFTT